jgi:hypothetical protein
MCAHTYTQIFVSVCRSLQFFYKRNRIVEIYKNPWCINHRIPVAFSSNLPLQFISHTLQLGQNLRFILVYISDFSITFYALHWSHSLWYHRINLFGEEWKSWRFSLHIVICRVISWQEWRILVQMIGFVSTLVTISLSHIQYRQYSTIADSHIPVHRCTRTRIPSLH